MRAMDEWIRREGELSICFRYRPEIAGQQTPTAAIGGGGEDTELRLVILIAPLNYLQWWILLCFSGSTVGDVKGRVDKGRGGDIYLFQQQTSRPPVRLGEGEQR